VRHTNDRRFAGPMVETIFFAVSRIDGSVKLTSAVHGGLADTRMYQFVPGFPFGNGYTYQ